MNVNVNAAGVILRLIFELYMVSQLHHFSAVEKLFSFDVDIPPRSTFLCLSFVVEVVLLSKVSPWKM